MSDTTILTYASTRHGQAEQSATAAQQRLTQAQAALVASSASIAQATIELTDLESTITRIRKELAAIPTPADGASLLIELEQTIILLRSKGAAISRFQAARDLAQAESGFAQADLRSATVQLGTAEKTLKQAEQSSDQRTALTAALGGAPLATIDDRAKDALDVTKPAGANFKAAKLRVETDIPAKLRTRARVRRSAEAARIAETSTAALAAEDAVLSATKANGGLAGDAARQLAVFIRTEAAARDFVNTAQSRFERAQVSLAQVADPTHSPITAEQEARINDPDTDLVSAREAAVDAEQDVDDKRDLLDAAITKFDAAVTALEADPGVSVKVQDAKDANDAVDAAKQAFDDANTAWLKEAKALTQALVNVDLKEAALAKAIRESLDPDADPLVKAAVDDLAKAKSDLADAEDDYRESNHGVLHAWQAAIPDTTWQLFADFEEAVETLTALGAQDPAQFALDLGTAEASYVAAISAADTAADGLAQLSGEQAQQSAAKQVAHQERSYRLFSALRGDN